MCVCVCVSLCVCLCVCLLGGRGCVCVCVGATRGRVRHMGVCVAAETEAGRPSQAKDHAACVCHKLGTIATLSLQHHMSPVLIWAVHALAVAHM